MDESGICRLGVKADRLCDSQSNDTLQHQDSNCAGASSRHSLQEDEDSNLIRKNRNLVNPVYCTQESRMEPPGPDGGKDPSDDQQDSQCNRNKGRTLGKEVLLLMHALNTLSTPEEKLAALCKTYADLWPISGRPAIGLYRSFLYAKINETDTFGPGDDDEIQFDDIGDDDEDIDDI